MSNGQPKITARRAIGALALVTVPAVLSTLETVMFASMSGRPIAPWRAFVAEAPQWYTWVFLAPMIVSTARRYRLRWPPAPRTVAVHVGVCLVCCAIISIADAVVNVSVRTPGAPLVTTARNWFISGLPVMTLVYFVIVAASYAVSNVARLREREHQSAVLEAELREAQLGALRMQLQPHFLFNSLNAVMALVRDADTARAVRALSLLSDVLRTTITANSAHQTTLACELDFVMRYLEVERVRFEDRLQVAVDVAPGLADALVPTFVLQPFVENSLKHGVLRERAANRIELGARVTRDTLVLTVRDDGVGLKSNAEQAAGVGIANARARLSHMYGSEARLSVNNVVDGPGVLAEIAFPLRRAVAT